MPKKPRIVRVVDERASRIGEMIDQAVEARLGPNATFEERQDAAAAVAAEVLAEFRASSTPGPKVGG